MRTKSRILVEQIKRSRASEGCDLSHFEALASDIQELGAETFLARVKALLEPPAPAKPRGTSHPLTREFENAQARTSLPERRDFIDAVIAQATSEHGTEFDLPKRRRTMPALLDAYSQLLTAEQLTELLWTVARVHSRNR